MRHRTTYVVRGGDPLAGFRWRFGEGRRRSWRDCRATNARVSGTSGPMAASRTVGPKQKSRLAWRYGDPIRARVSASALGTVIPALKRSSYYAARPSAAGSTRPTNQSSSDLGLTGQLSSSCERRQRVRPGLSRGPRTVMTLTLRPVSALLGRSPRFGHKDPGPEDRVPSTVPTNPEPEIPEWQGIARLPGGRVTELSPMRLQAKRRCLHRSDRQLRRPPAHETSRAGDPGRAVGSRLPRAGQRRCCFDG
jgi:hypothetical protein